MLEMNITCVTGSAGFPAFHQQGLHHCHGEGVAFWVRYRCIWDRDLEGGEWVLGVVGAGEPTAGQWVMP